MKVNKVLAILLIFGAVACSNSHSRSFRDTPVVKVIERYAPAVVNIRTETVLDLKELPEWGEYGSELDRFLKDYFGRAYSKGTLKYKSIGSGVIVSSKGFIVTNAHVVLKAKNIYAVLNDGTILEAEVIKVSGPDDLALIKVNLPKPVVSPKLANFADVMIGETVIAIGNPLGLENSVTVGVISGKDRDFSSSRCVYICSGLLQTDASINPGNSGGALLNLDGELVGINLAVVQNAQNIGFAIPASKIENLLR
ncbi:MAG: trypsin-like peptidase domain-containing protein [Desulforhabdus sp.]|jgi:serine protease Do|nr:trypsin-like peptidase domain-containing protein [Desulforhabdus sp.]